MARTLGVCSWSLRPESPEQLADLVSQTGCRAVQLHLDPIRTRAWSFEHTRDVLHAAGICIVSGMMTTEGEDYSTLESIRETGGVRPDATWNANRAAAEHNALIAGSLGLSLVTLHAGFLPHEPGAERDTLLDRLADLAAIFGTHGVRLGLETGQESAATLRDVLRDLAARTDARGAPCPGVNFDPANMILYGMGDPIEALEGLAGHVVQIHAKDATPTGTPGTWGTEVPVGEGAVDWPRFFGIVKGYVKDAGILIEREAGEQRVEDVGLARRRIAGWLDELGEPHA